MGLLIGLDGGGAKTTGALCDREGHVLARSRGDGSAVVGLPEEPFFAIIGPILETLTRTAGVGFDQVDCLVIGLSGVDFPDESRAQQQRIANRFGLGDRLVLVNDGLVALWGVSPAERLTLVQHGSGVTTAYRAAHGQEAIFDSLDVANVFDLRRAAVAATARMIDGRASPTPLRDAVLTHCGVDAADFAEWCMRSPEARIRRASLAEVVFAAWRNGDPAASELVLRAAQDYALTTAAMGRSLGEGRFLASFAGGVIQQGGPAFQAVLEEALAKVCPQAERIDAMLPPEFGALMLGGWRAGLGVRDLFARLAAQCDAGSEPA